MKTKCLLHYGTVWILTKIVSWKRKQRLKLIVSKKSNNPYYTKKKIDIPNDVKRKNTCYKVAKFFAHKFNGNFFQPYINKQQFSLCACAG